MSFSEQSPLNVIQEFNVFSPPQNANQRRLRTIELSTYVKHLIFRQLPSGNGGLNERTHTLMKRLEYFRDVLERYVNGRLQKGGIHRTMKGVPLKNIIKF